MKTLSVLSFLFIGSLLAGCTYKIKEPFPVTYEVVIRSNFKPSYFIAYTDSSGRKDLMIDSTWRQSVILPPGETASLLVYPLFNQSVIEHKIMHDQLCNGKLAVFTSRIVHEEKTVEDISTSISSIILTQKGIILSKRKG